MSGTETRHKLAARCALFYLSTSWLLAGAGGASAVTVTVNLSTEYQTIEGFGGFGAQKVWWSGAPYFNAAWINYLVSDLGLTLLRDEVHSGFECTNENTDPASLDLTRFQLSSGCTGVDATFAAHVPYWQAMKAKADSLNEPMRLLGTVWSPPPWMKKSGLVKGAVAAAPDPAVTQVALKDDATTYAEYGEFLAAWVKLVKAQAGIDVYALSIQNEPVFEEPYASCVYSPQKYRDVLKVVGKRFEAEGLSKVFFIGPEDVANSYRFPIWIDGICSDTLARRYLHATALHGYAANGITPVSPGATEWGAYASKARQYGKQVWMTETGASGDWSGALNGGKGIYNGLVYGGLTAWTWWYTCDNLFTGGAAPNKAFYVLKQYSRFVRPDAKRVSTTSSDAALGVVAFNHRANGCITIVFITDGTTAKDVSVSGTGLPTQFKAFRSSATENCADLGTVSAASVSLPASSMTTLVSGKYIGSLTTAVAPDRRVGQPAAGPFAPDAARSVTLYNLRGQAAGNASMLRTGAAATGVYCARVGSQKTIRVLAGNNGR